MHIRKKTQLFGLFLAGAALPAWSSPADINSDPKKVVETMNHLFTALGKENVDQFHEVTCPNFYMFDNGKLFSGDQVMDVIKHAHAAGTSFVWNVTQPQVHIDGHTAWITYVNQGAIVNASGTKDMKWLESAILNRSSAGWCIQFAHSTRMASK